MNFVSGLHSYRPACGGLDEAMQHVCYFADIRDLISYVAFKHQVLERYVSFSDPQGFDNRIGWNNWRYVRIYDVDYGGWCNVGFYSDEWQVDCNEFF